MRSHGNMELIGGSSFWIFKMSEEKWSVLKLKKQTRLTTMDQQRATVNKSALLRRMLVVAILGTPDRWQQLSQSVCQDCCLLSSVPNRLTAKCRAGEVRVKQRSYMGLAPHFLGVTTG